MQLKKMAVLILIIVVFVAAAYSLIEPTDHAESIQEVFDERIDYNDYLNLREENRMLQETNQSLQRRIFEYEFEVVRLSFNYEQMNRNFPFPNITEIVYKDIGETKFVILYKAEEENHLVLGSKEEEYIKHLLITDLLPEDINWTSTLDPDYLTLGGVVTDKEIKNIKVLVDREEYQAEVIRVNEHYSIWYFVYEYEPSRSEWFTIQALNEEGNVIWNETFKGGWML